ncbi:MAG: DEAD/DEAH box helicase [Brooklawnia sp.]|uniref:DEAD/DEAH box helicase n=1 Tax=Brooklawnia sp. TaxID=2699740 RepID=UPI003C743205
MTENTTTFADLGVAEPIVQALAEAGIEHPFPIQELAIPIALTGADMIGQARTGTGKTLAFGAPLLQHLILPGHDDFDEFDHYGKPQALVMTPTRELALQVTSDLTTASKKLAARILTIYGGVGYDDQLDTLADGVDVVVGTPGRLLDLANRKSLDLSQVQVLVLDEADEMLDLGFLPDVERLAGMTPRTKQTLMFSATMPAQIIALARAHLNQPVHVRAEGHDAQATVPDTTQFVYQAHDLDKPEIIGKLLQSTVTEKVMIFTRTKRAAQRLADELADRGFDAAAIHGDLNQAQRERTLKKFRRGTTRVLVATDVAARGIDVAGVSHVVNYEVPDDAQQYVHRIGRTGRAGRSGIAVTLVDWRDITRWNVINKALGLDFADPVETYSTSPHLMEQLQIPEGTKGRLAASRKTADADNRAERPRRHKSQRHAGKDDKKSDRPRRKRIRRRDGKVVERSDRQPPDALPESTA